MSMDLESTFESVEDLTTAQALAAERYPEIAHLAEFITASNGQGVLDLAADMSRRLKQSQVPGGNPGPKTTANGGEEASPVLPGDHPSSAAVLESVRRGERDNDTHDARRDWIRAKLLEAGQEGASQ
jgi:hypothetical protein